jgi:hypothetical protein
MVSKTLSKELEKELYNFERLNDLCLSLNEAAQGASFCAYVTFDNEFSYRQCLKKLQNLELLTYALQQDKYKMDGQTVFIRVCIYMYIFA